VSLQKGDIENFGSHFSDNPSEVSSSGDERTRWKEFTYLETSSLAKSADANAS